MRIALAALALLLTAPPESAQEEKQEIQVTGLAGWGAYVTRGDWTPVILDLDNRGRKDVDLKVSVVWAAGFASQNSTNPTLDNVFGRTGPVTEILVPLPAKSRKRHSLCLMTPDLVQCNVWAFAQDARSGRTLARFEMLTRAADPQKRIVGIVGQARPQGLENETTVLASLQADELPEQWQGYGSLDALVWIDGRATELRSAAQAEALRQWISSGGRFYLMRSNTLNLGGTPVADLLPVKLGAGRELEGLGHNRFPEGRILVLDNTLRKGLIRATVDGIPLVVEATRDAGTVTFVAVDPTRAPFPDSPRTRDFWIWLLQLGPPPPAENIERERAPASIGSLALAQQAGRFPDIAAPEIGGLFMLIILYLVVVGPLDYFLLRWLRKLEYTWFTFPSYVVLFTLFILLVGGAFIQRAAHQREIVVEDHYAETGFLHRHALSAVLAPADVIYQVEDAVPLSSNFIDSQRSFDTGGKVTDVILLPGPPAGARNWLLNRNYTGLALADRCINAPSPLTYTITAHDTVSIRIQVQNTSTRTYESSTLVAKYGVYFISSIPPGESTV